MASTKKNSTQHVCGRRPCVHDTTRLVIMNICVHDTTKLVIMSEGMRSWFAGTSELVLHRTDGGPALERTCTPVPVYAKINRAWYAHGVRHRAGGLPAVEYSDGTLMYYEHGKRHRAGGLLAVKWPDGLVEYWIDGYETTPPARVRVIMASVLLLFENSTTRKWYVRTHGDEKYYLERADDGPTFEYVGAHKPGTSKIALIWYKHGKAHRGLGLPAVVWVNGARAWYINGEQSRPGGLPVMEGSPYERD